MTLVDNIKGRAELSWTPSTKTAFQKTKYNLAQTTLLEYPQARARVALSTDSSDFNAFAAI